MSKIALVFVLTLALIGKHAEGLFGFGKVEVTIFNGLDIGNELIIHCKSKHHDLGTHYISGGGEYYTFTVHKSIFDNTLYFCGFTFDNELHWFDIYVQVRDAADERTCRDGCLWTIEESGPCAHTRSRTGFLNHCYRWNEH
ncbi:hypothetical protein RND81_02G065100 [Saponaria officinalis]|uniref:S-protein homolog n=1 Tax=Saponaria officinalis TaxID=3572 RepID=A0AAW1MUE4_SAPOF